MLGLGLALLGLVVSSVEAQAPLPQALKDAKRVYLLNTAGTRQQLDELAFALRKWGRFELVGERANADVVFELSTTRAGTMTAAVLPGGQMAVARTGPERPTLSVFAPGEAAPLWHDSDRAILKMARRLCEAFEGKLPALIARQKDHPCRMR
jgi:hypothetical protein